MTTTYDARAALREGGLDPDRVAGLVRAGLEEDLDGGVDVTTEATVPATARASGDFVLSVQGPTQALLTAERTALNFLCHLSGIATATRRWVDAVRGTGARVRDTRKTTPLLWSLEKYAVRCGGGVNHRMSLAAEALVKDNHVVAAGGVGAAQRLVRERFPGVPVESEVTRLDQLEEVLAAGADSILLDNMAPQVVRDAVAIVRGRATVEASGRLTLEGGRAVAEAGVDFLAVGALTHSAPALDIAFDLREHR
ncbi:MAG: carboxylating nicotinate-nucleotide diphosphorylase [Actinomycetota bacterium]|nr:carboxylating nicotinate-nucleotide diphosphorylase [Actinomycetota bacterium]